MTIANRFREYRERVRAELARRARERATFDMVYSQAHEILTVTMREIDHLMVQEGLSWKLRWQENHIVLVSLNDTEYRDIGHLDKSNECVYFCRPNQMAGIKVKFDILFPTDLAELLVQAVVDRLDGFEP